TSASVKLSLGYLSRKISQRPRGGKIMSPPGANSSHRRNTNYIRRCRSLTLYRIYELSLLTSDDIEREVYLIFCGDGAADGRYALHVVVAVTYRELAARRHSVSLKSDLSGNGHWPGYAVKREIAVDLNLKFSFAVLVSRNAGAVENDLLILSGLE